MKKIIAFLLTIVSVFTVSFAAAGCDKWSTDRIRYVIFASGGSLDDSDRIKASVNKITRERLGFGIELEYLGYTDFVSKVGLYYSTKEKVDMFYSGSVLSGLSYSSRAARGEYKDITTLLPEYAPDVYASMSEDVWKAAKVNNKIYGVINEQIFARSVGLAIDEQVAKAINLTQERIDEENLTYRDCVNMAMEYIAADETISPNGKIPSTTLVIGDAWQDIFMQNYALDPLGTDSLVPGIIEAGQNKTTVINQFESEYFREFIDFCKEMHDKGYIIKDQVANPVTANQRVRITGTYKPGSEASLYSSIGRRFKQFRFGQPLLTTYNVTTSMTVINTLSPNADKCLQFINLMYTDKEFYNLVAIGEEGIDYEWKTGKDENGELYDYISYIKTSKYKLNTDWSVGTEFNAYRKFLQSATVVQDTKKLNAEGLMSPAYGFTYRPQNSTITAMIDSCHSTVRPYIDMFLVGTYDKNKTTSELMAEINNKLKTMGLDQIIAAKQAQLDAFLK